MRFVEYVEQRRKHISALTREVTVSPWIAPIPFYYQPTIHSIIKGKRVSTEGAFGRLESCSERVHGGTNDFFGTFLKF